MMTCETFEQMLADALGGELSTSDRQAFDRHMAACATCQQEYTSRKEAVDALRGLASPSELLIYREGDRLILQPAGAAPSRSPRTRRLVRRPLLIAAGLLFAFTAGYSMRMFGGPASDAPSPPIENRFDGETLADALVLAHQRSPGRTDLVKCFNALFSAARTR